MKKYLFSELIEEITELNTELLYGLDDIVGVTIEKGLIPTIANLTKTELNKFYIVKPDTFVFNPRTHGVRLGMGYNDTENTYITSWNNVAFKVKDEARTLLNPEYLWLYFNRTEWDRETNYHAWGSSTIVFSWNTFRNLSIKLPEKEVQDKIVRQYKVKKNRIKLKKQINDNLEATLNTVFVKMYEETDEDSSVLLSELCSLASSKRVFAEDYVSDGVPFYRGKEITQKRNGEPISDPLFISHNHFASLKANYGIPVCGDILITAVGTIGNSYFVQDEEFYFKDGNIIWLKDFIEPSLNYYIYDYMQTPIFKRQLEGICIGSTQTALTIVALSNLKVKKPRTAELALYCKKSKALRSAIQTNNGEIERLTQVAKAMLASLSR